MHSYYLSDGQIVDLLEKTSACEEFGLDKSTVEEFDFLNFQVVDYTFKTKGCRFQVVENITFKVPAKDSNSSVHILIAVRIGEKEGTIEILQFITNLLG